MAETQVSSSKSCVTIEGSRTVSSGAQKVLLITQHIGERTSPMRELQFLVRERSDLGGATEVVPSTDAATQPMLDVVGDAQVHRLCDLVEPLRDALIAERIYPWPGLK